VRSLHAHTDGLPLFVVNVIDDLLSQGAIAPEVEGGLAEATLDAQRAVPENLAGVIEAQIGRLSGELRALLTIASAAGMEFQPETVADAIGRDAAWVHEQYGAQRHIDEGLALAQRMGETVAIPDLLLQQARIAIGRGDRDAARRSLQEAVTHSRLHGALGYEIDGLIGLCELDDAAAQDIQALREACAALPDGFDSELAKRAGSVLVKR